ncbi:VanZ family protein [Labedella phragmitis]|uniref:VanZ family protein n=1 Tax=Labedella phragmitis TaxID=2498849 RepID=UPI001AA01779|nr:VanZ family protein [Labedella phragmitis]
MISTVLAENPPLVRSLLVFATVVAVVVAASLAAGGRSGRLLAVGLSLGGIGVVGVLTLSPVGSGGPRQPACNVEPYNWFGDTPNVALFLLPAIFLVVATRSAALVAVLGPVGSAAVELAQYAFPELGRRCDVDDLLANSGGAVAGALMGAVILWSVRLAHRRSPVADASPRSGTPSPIPEYR